MKERPYKGIEIRTDLMEESGKVLLFSQNLTEKHRKIHKYLQCIFEKNSVGLDEHLTDYAIEELKYSIGSILDLNNIETYQSIDVVFETGGVEDNLPSSFCCPFEDAKFIASIVVNQSGLNILNCIQHIEFDSSNKITSIKTYKLCTKN